MITLKHPCFKKLFSIGLLVLLFSLAKVGVEGWANTSPEQNWSSITRFVEDKMDEKTKIMGTTKHGFPEAVSPISGKKDNEPTESETTVTILKPAMESSFPGKGKSSQEDGVQEKKKFGLALLFLGCMAEENL